MNHSGTFSIPYNETQNDNRLSPLKSRSPRLSHDSASIDHDDNDAPHRSPDVNTSLLRKLSLVDLDEKTSKYDFRRNIWFKAIITCTCIASVVSVCLNTPLSFSKYPDLKFVTFGIDIAVVLILTAEITVKSAEKGFFHAQNSYLRSRGRIFEFIMVISSVRRRHLIAV